MLSNTRLSSLRELDLSWDDVSCFNQSFDPGSLLNPDTGVDDLSVALRRIAQLPTIKVLKLRTAFLLSPEFFSSEATENDRPTVWPSLQILDLQLSSMTPAGDWYTTGDPSLAQRSEDRSTPSDDEGVDSADSATADEPPVRMWQVRNGNVPYNSWRTQPGEPYNMFLLKVANAIPLMPALRRLTCQMGHMDLHRLAIKVEYLAARESMPIHQNGRYRYSQERIFYNWPHWEIILEQEHSGHDDQTVWEIPEELKQALRCNTGPHGSIHIANQAERTELI